MSMILDEGTIGQWHVELPGHTGNWLMSCRRDPKTGEWDVQYRFRYYLDDKAHDSDDERNWYRITPGKDVPDAKVVEMCREAALKMAQLTGSAYSECVREPGETANHYFARFMGQPHMNAKHDAIPALDKIIKGAKNR